MTDHISLGVLIALGILVNLYGLIGSSADLRSSGDFSRYYKPVKSSGGAWSLWSIYLGYTLRSHEESTHVG
jgi:hypothetical protein